MQVVEVELASRDHVLDLLELAIDRYFLQTVLQHVHFGQIVEILDKLIDSKAHLSKLRLIFN